MAEQPPSLEAIMASLRDQPWYWQLLVLSLLGPLVMALSAPALQELRNVGFQHIPDVPLSPSDLASAVNRGFLDHNTDTQQEAAQSGVNPDRFATLIQLAGQALAPEAAAEALRRGLIPEDSGDPDKPGYLQAIRQGNLRDMWAPVLAALSRQLPAPATALAAWLEGQTDEQTARALYRAWGGAETEHVPGVGDVDIAGLLYHTQGQAPTPIEALQLANRGIIPWTGKGPDVVSYEQAFLEGPWRNKWMDAMRALGEYLPPPRTIVAMLREGSLDDEQALRLLRHQGLAEDLAAAYVAGAHRTKTQAAHSLARATVEELYRDQIITAARAAEMLQALGYSAHDAAWLLAVVDLRREQQQVSAAISRVRSQFVARRISRVAATSVLAQLGLPSEQSSRLVATWQIEAAANVRVLSESQVVDAWAMGLLSQADAQSRLEALGYSPDDAWVLLSLKAKAPLPHRPATQ